MSKTITITPQQKLTIDILNKLHANWTPNEMQLEAGRAIVNDDVDTVFLQCGRKAGKSEMAIYLLWRIALLKPNAQCYYVAPEFSHGKKLIWNDPRLLQMGPKDLILSVNSTECIIKLKNGSVIQILGSENFQAANGLRPAFLVYDEFCEFNYRFHETMQPNRIVNKCPLMIIGTPPLQGSKNREQYINYAEECKSNKRAKWLRYTSYSNPHIDPKWLDEERNRLFARGEEYLWYSQYEALITAGGKNIVFPMMGDKHVYDHNRLVDEIRRDVRNLEWYCIVDPGTTTVMAFLFAAINPYSKQIYIMDEIYEKKASETSVSLVVPRAIEIARELAPSVDFGNDWIKVYDEAAAWFSNEAHQQFGIYFMPTLKAHNKKEHGISLIKDILVHGVIKISSRCVNLVNEMKSYVAKEDGSFPKGGDHLLDTFRYLLASASYTMVEVKEAARLLGPRNPADIDNSVQHKSFSGDLDDLDWTSEFD